MFPASTVPEVAAEPIARANGPLAHVVPRWILPRVPRPVEEIIAAASVAGVKLKVDQVEAVLDAVVAARRVSADRGRAENAAALARGIEEQRRKTQPRPVVKVVGIVAVDAAGRLRQPAAPILALDVQKAVLAATCTHAGLELVGFVGEDVDASGKAEAGLVVERRLVTWRPGINVIALDGLALAGLEVRIQEARLPDSRLTVVGEPKPYQLPAVRKAAAA